MNPGIYDMGDVVTENSNVIGSIVGDTIDLGVFPQQQLMDKSVRSSEISIDLRDNLPSDTSEVICMSIVLKK